MLKCKSGRKSLPKGIIAPKGALRHINAEKRRHSDPYVASPRPPRQREAIVIEEPKSADPELMHQIAAKFSENNWREVPPAAVFASFRTVSESEILLALEQMAEEGHLRHKRSPSGIVHYSCLASREEEAGTIVLEFLRQNPYQYRKAMDIATETGLEYTLVNTVLIREYENTHHIRTWNGAGQPDSEYYYLP